MSIKIMISFSHARVSMEEKQKNRSSAKSKETV
jgi:hypothetical protein